MRFGIRRRHQRDGAAATNHRLNLQTEAGIGGLPDLRQVDGGWCWGPLIFRAAHRTRHYSTFAATVTPDISHKRRPYQGPGH
jgi:hypothetical protein